MLQLCTPCCRRYGGRAYVGTLQLSACCPDPEAAAHCRAKEVSEWCATALKHEGPAWHGGPVSIVCTNHDCRQWKEQQQRQLKKGGASTATSTAPAAAPTAAAPLPQRTKVPAPRAAGPTTVNKQNPSLPDAPRASAPAATAAPAAPPSHTISATAASLEPSTSLAWSLWDSGKQLDAHRQLARVATSTQLAQLARAWADAWAGSHPVSAEQRNAAQANVEALATAALARVRQASVPTASSSSSNNSLAPAAPAAASIPQQELADLGWSLMHFPHPEAQDAARELEAAMHVPFRVLPHQMPQLSLAAFRAEVELRQDTITLRDLGDVALWSHC